VRYSRKHDRRDLQQRVWIKAGAALEPCWMVDISPGGARLLFDRVPRMLPETVQLYLSPTAETFRKCVVRWWKVDSVGVQFLPS
jgi:hypothetical protein